MKINFKKIAFLGLLLTMFGFLGSNSTFACHNECNGKHNYYKANKHCHKNHHYKNHKHCNDNHKHYKKHGECCEEKMMNHHYKKHAHKNHMMKKYSY